ncbi:TonB-dependent receptor [Novosphingobium sp. G106]|uniref:TonB-dependent receptor n=1 Tax=Novosphingobium sp. G106 TaxID=2849500 RepID=UPI001C2D97BB|nr:TonB-dependent receptor [Novosphingobium sp. G106]MBV1686219.1 TonB-dependent receptor [Novosphingobium sp. G106]
MNSTGPQFRSALFAGAILLLPAKTFAQTEVKGPAAQAVDTGSDIVVTAQRRSELLQDVPMSIKVLSADDLARSGVNSTSDIAQVAPSVVMQLQGGFLQPAIRGVSSTGANVGDNSNVAIYLDGVYQPQQSATQMDLPDVQSIEVLKGPQGSLYGQNATGGAILISTMAPSFDITGKISASYGNYNDINVRGFVSGPINNNIAASLSGGIQNRDGFRTHIVTGQRESGLESAVARGKLLFELSETARVTVTGFYSKRTDSSAYAGFALNGNSTGYVLIPGAPRVTSAKNFGTNPDVFFTARVYGGNIHAEIDVGPGTLNTMTAYTNNRINWLADVDYSPTNFAESQATNSGHYFVQEMNFVSKDMGPVSFIVGGLYLTGTEELFPNIFRLRSPNLPPSAPIAPTFLLENWQRLDKEVYAGYAEITYRPTSSLVLTAGGRFTYEKQHGFAKNFTTGNLEERPKGPASFSKFTPRVTARYELDQHSNIYASYSQGFKSGVINAANLSQDPVNPEVITAYEVGYKGTPLPGVHFNLAAFYYDYKDLQVVAYAPPVYIQQNAASARIKGVDVDLNWAVTPQLTLAGGISLLDGKYRKFPGAQVFVPHLPAGTLNATGGANDTIAVDLSGKRMLRTPKVTATFSANYTVKISAGRVEAFGSVYYNDGYGYEVSNRLGPSHYATVSGELAFSPSALEGLRLVLWGKNLTDKAYLANFLVSNFADGGNYGDPRTYGVRAEFRF